jgi:stringent starvation protein B
MNTPREFQTQHAERRAREALAQARFSGQVFDVWIPAENIVALFAKETGHGIALPNEMFTADEPGGEQPTPPAGSGKASGGGFKRVK